MTSHQAKFGETTCEVHIEPHPTVNGGPVFIARVFQLDSNGTALREIHSDKQRQVELVRDSEQQALGAAADFFESRFGPKEGDWTDPTVTRGMIAILPPRRQP